MSLPNFEKLKVSGCKFEIRNNFSLGNGFDE